MKKQKKSLVKQLIIIILLVFSISFILLGIVLPKTLIPLAEDNIYRYLSEPLKFINSDFNSELESSEVAYLYVFNNKIAVSDNLDDLIDANNPIILLNYFRNNYGKFSYKHCTYYYYMVESDGNTKIALTNDSYILKTKADILKQILPIVLGTIFVISLVLLVWSYSIIYKIERLKMKVDNIDNSDYNHKINFKTDDEIKSLEYAIEDMRISLKNQEEYRNTMYQNISHDFKTPLTVIKSYIEAVHDDV